MINQYNIKAARPAGSVWQGGPQNSNFQTFFLEVEGVQKTVMINRKAESPLLSGLTWLELTETPSKSKPGTTYYKAKVVQAPDGVQARQQPIPMAGVASADGTAWGQALIAAATWLAPKTEKELQGVTAILNLAKDLYLADVPDRAAMEEAKKAMQDSFVAKSGDTVLTEVPDEVDVSELPF